MHFLNREKLSNAGCFSLIRMDTSQLSILFRILVLLKVICLANSLQDSSNRAFGVPGVNPSFDYIIVGGGTAGLTVASRLAEDRALSVAVIEAGGYYEADNGNLSVTPGYDAAYAGTDPTLTNPKVDWGFDTTPQEGAAGRRLHYPRGKTLGGSSATNFMYYHRPTVGSAQKWASDTGDQSYTFRNLLPFYEKSIHYTPPEAEYQYNAVLQDSTGFLSNGGSLQVSFGHHIDPLANWSLNALQMIGQEAISGFQNGNLLGSAYVPATIRPSDASRSSSESSFLQLALKNTTIKVYNNTLANKILFAGKTATGISVTSSSSAGNGKSSYVLSARKEVIVSAGTFQSPQLLMVSGIGPRRTLESLDIPVLKDLPGVGQNLWDQPFFGTSFRVRVPTASAGLNNPELAIAAVQEYLHNASGPLSIPGTGVLGFEKLPATIRNGLSKSTQQALSDTFPSDWPDLEFLPAGAFFGNNSNYLTVDPRDGYNYATLSTALVAPLSRGNVTINSTSMSDPPLINPNWLTHPADEELAVAAFKRQREVWKHMRNITIGEEYYPGSSVQTDADILRAIRRSLAPIWHAAATCKMGKPTDEMAVVDPNMRVYGVQRLRIVDASSFPFLPPGHPQATVYALAEKIASEIMQDPGMK
ncbi:MAG: hypothetical protein Q9225_002813 [Loekoesia sp. 1 TL-2023]